MDRETLGFGAPLAGFVVGALVLIFGIFQGGLTAITVAGAGIMAMSIALLAFAVFQAL